MTYDSLKKYLLQQMKMTHVYQPLMLKRLLIGHGSAKVEEIALDLVQNDLSQIEYYTDRVHNMVGRVLSQNSLASWVFSKAWGLSCSGNSSLLPQWVHAV